MSKKTFKCDVCGLDYDKPAVKNIDTFLCREVCPRCEYDHRHNKTNIIVDKHYFKVIHYPKVNVLEIFLSMEFNLDNEEDKETLSTLKDFLNKVIEDD